MNIKTDEQIEKDARSNLSDIDPKKLWGVGRFSLTEEELEEAPKTLNCDKHGEFELKTHKSIMFKKYMFNSVCSKCIDEFDALLDVEVKRLTRINNENKRELETQNRIKALKSRGVSKRSLDKNFDSYNADTNEKLKAKSECVRLCDSIISGENQFNMLMVGGVGTGKTHLANACVINLYDNNKSCVRINMIDMIRDVKKTWSKDCDYSESDVIEYFVDRDLLIIDEVGIQFGSDTEKMIIFDIINGRYEECLPTVIISNLSIDGVKEIIGERCIDRLREDGGKVIAFDWQSNRGFKN